jgi:hypothetical protein
MSFNGRDLDRKAEGLQSNGSDLGRKSEGAHRTGSDLDRKYWPALALFLALGVLVWFTIGEGAVDVLGRRVEIRLVALLVIGSFALRTFLARQADRIRHSGDQVGPAPKDL